MGSVRQFKACKEKQNVYFNTSGLTLRSTNAKQPGLYSRITC